MLPFQHPRSFAFVLERVGHADEAAWMETPSGPLNLIAEAYIRL